MPDLKSPRVLLAIAWSVFQLYTAYAGLYDLLIQLPVHVAFATALGFLTEPTPDSTEAAEARRRRRPRRRLDGALAGLALLCAAHYVWHNGRLASRMAMVEAPLLTDVAVGMLFTVLLLWASWRHIGPSLVVLALAFVVYAFVGPWLPGFLAHGGESFLTLVDQQTLTTQGIFGIPALVSATFIFLFVVFGSVMSHGGLLRCFTDGALAVAGGTRGGAGKVAVISSGLFGMVNGSAIANAVTTGAFTIPLMMRAGYRPAFAAGVEACASMGGQLIPPVMGAAAFQKGLGAMHALAHPVGAVLDAHHGLSNAVVMPYVLAFNRDAIQERMDRAARTRGRTSHLPASMISGDARMRRTDGSCWSRSRAAFGSASHRTALRSRSEWRGPAAATRFARRIAPRAPSRRSCSRPSSSWVSASRCGSSSWPNAHRRRASAEC